MNIIIAKDYAALSEKAARIIIETVRAKPDAVLGLATGTTPLGLYKRLIADHKENGTSYKHIRAVNLDEYKGLPKDHPQSYAYFMRKNLFDHIDIDVNNTYIENGILIVLRFPFSDIYRKSSRYSPQCPHKNNATF